MKYAYSIIYVPVQNFLLQIFSFDPKKAERRISTYHEDRYVYNVEVEKTYAFLSRKDVDKFWVPEKIVEMSLYEYEDKTYDSLNETVKMAIKEVFLKSHYLT